MRRSILARVKFLSRLLTALNLLPSIATLACVSRPTVGKARRTGRKPCGSQARYSCGNLNVALALKPAARLNPIEITIASLSPSLRKAEPLAVSPVEAARLAGLGRTTIYAALGSGALRS